MTANPKPDASKLVAGVLKGLESADYAFWEVAKSSLKGTAGLKIPTAEASKAFVAYVDYVAKLESELSDLRTREAKLAEFVEWVRDNAKRVGGFEMSERARDLLAKLAEGKTR